MKPAVRIGLQASRLPLPARRSTMGGLGRKIRAGSDIFFQPHLLTSGDGFPASNPSSGSLNFFLRRPMPRFFPLPLLWMLTVTMALAAEPALPKKISFNRDIRPIMSDTCFHCHGFDPKTREEDLRLDIRDEALKATKNEVIPIVPGNPDKSEIITRIFDREDPMPPDKAHKPLTDRQKALFRQWVAEGAHYEPHWAYAPLQKPDLPPSGHPQNPVDAFIRARLAEKQIAPSPEAPRAKLLRRLSLDLTGLPPTPAEVTAFLNDGSPRAYDRQVERLLASVRFGERMAVWWLDVARYADTVGFHGDQNQRIFPYRDYVIQAFNANKRFDQFTIEQLAGDLLPDPSPEQRVATGYNRLNMMTREGGAQPKEYLAKYGAERVRSVAAAWFGSTFGCAECHDHKFDPIKTRDFYELQSFFADVRQWGVYADYGYTPEPELKGVNNDSPFPPEIEVASPYLEKRRDQAGKALAAHLAATSKRLANDSVSAASLAAWETDLRQFLATHPGGWAKPLASAAILKDGKPDGKRSAILSKDGTIHPDKPLGKNESLRVAFSPDGLPGLAAIRIDLTTEGLDDKTLEASYGKSLKLAVSIVQADGKERKMGTGVGEATVKRRTYRNGDEIPGLPGEWKLPFTKSEVSLRAVWLLDVPVKPGAGETVVCSFSGDCPLPLKIAVTPLGASDAMLAADPATLAALLETPAKRAPQQAQAVHDAWLFSTAQDRSAFDTARVLAEKIREWNGGRAWSLVTEAVASPLTVRVLPRGNFLDTTGPVVLPATPSFLPGRLESTVDKRLTRLDLARWIVSEQNPITARAVMNRLWQLFFGTGLSATVDDLGSQGEPPSHPELLDWLASEFRDSGWDLKHMITLIVSSQTYRQSSLLRPELHEADPSNRLLASQNPRRLDAEFVRDNALFIAGILNLEDVGGPGVKPYQPAGYYAAIQFPNRDYVANTDAGQWRRGLYMHWQRTFLHPMLANFDAPPRDECAALRTVSNTPQQALTLLNDPTFVEAARLFAGRLLSEPPGADDTARLKHAFQLALARDPRPGETASLMTFLTTQRRYYRDNLMDADKLLKVGLAPQPAGDPAEAAAWTNLCRVLLNSHETITRY